MRKRYKTAAWFLLKLNRKLYALYRVAALPMHLTRTQRSQHEAIIGVRGVGMAGATGALAPAMLKPRGLEYLFAPAIFSHTHAKQHAF